MPTVRYSNHSGRVRGQVSAGARTTYLTDALGSVTATVDGAGATVNAYRHKPYGGLLAKVGAGADPRYLWTGDTGSRCTGLPYSEQHNRARHYGSVQAGWTSKDPTMWRIGLTGYFVWNMNPVSGHPLGQQGTCDLSQIPSYPLLAHSMDPPPSKGNCGSWGAPIPYKVAWDLSGVRAWTKSAGWIIQEIDNKPFDIPSCVRGTANCTRKEGPDTHYWEGWWVTASNKIQLGDPPQDLSPKGPHDIFSDPQACECHIGSKVRYAYAKFYPADFGRYKAWGWTPGNGQSGRIDLLGGPKPLGWSNVGSYTRSITANFNCCSMTPVPGCPPYSVPICYPRPTVLQ